MMSFAEVLLAVVRGFAMGTKTIALFSFSVFFITTTVLLLRDRLRKDR